MLQRGLAILLSVCMLAGNGGSTVYAMNPQVDAQVVADTGSVLDNEDSGEEPDVPAGDNGEEPDVPAGDNGGALDVPAGDGDIVPDVPAGDGDIVPDVPAGDGDIVLDVPAGDDGEKPDAPAEDASDDDKGTVDAPEGDNGTVEDVPEEDGSVTGDETDKDHDAADTTEDDNSSVSDNDDEDDIEVVEEETEIANTTAISGVKAEELTLTTDAAQTVTLAASEKQWLSFDAPEEGYYKFYSTSEGDSNLYKILHLYHNKTDEYGFAYDYGSGENGNFNYTYHIKNARERVYLLVEFSSSSASGTFVVHAEKVTPPEFTVNKNVQESSTLYTLTAGGYQLKLDMNPSYRQVKVSAELRQADGTALTEYNSYKIEYRYNYGSDGRGTSGSLNLNSVYNSDNNAYDYNQELIVSYAEPGEKIWFSELALYDSNNNNVLATLGADQQEIAVNTKTTDKLGILTEVTPEDAFVSVNAEMTSNQNGRIRYRKKDESEWTYYEDTLYNAAKIEFAAEPDTDYVIELTGTDMETVYDRAEVRTKAFAAQNITAETTDITSSGAKIKVNVGSYTGDKKYICARVSYTDALGDSHTATDYLSASSLTRGITLQLSNLAAGAEYKDLEVELDDTDYSYMSYVAYSTKVTFTTAVSALTADKIAVTATPDATDGTKAVLQTKLEGVSDGTYSYTAKYRVAGSKDWTASRSVTGTLNTYNSYTDEQNLTSLMGNTEYEVMVMVDGTSKATFFTTKAAAVAAQVEVEPLMQGVRVNAALTGVSSGDYRIYAYYYDVEQHQWMYSYNYDQNCVLDADNDWKTTTVLYSDNIRPNAENDWKITITEPYGRTIYEKYLTLEAVHQEITLTAETIRRTSASIRAKLSAWDESVQSAYADVYYREKGAEQWIEYGSCNYGSTDGGTAYLYNLKGDTEYECKFVSQDDASDILAQTTFRTLKDTRMVSVSAEGSGYTSGQINWTFDTGENAPENSSRVYLYYREKGNAAWTYVSFQWVYETESGREALTGLSAGTAYEVLVELKDNSNSTAEVDAVKSATAEFTTAAVDHMLTASPVENETKAASVALNMQLTKPTGALVNRAKAVVTLTPASGISRSKEVFLDKDNGYKDKLVISGLVPETKYVVSARLYESERNQWMSLKDYDLGEITTAKADVPTSLTLSEGELFLNKGAWKQLTVTAQPEEAAAGLAWTSSDAAVAAVDRNGKVTAVKAGEADITVSAAADGKLSAVCHVTVQDYAIRVKNENGSYDGIPDLLSRAQKRTLVVYDNAAAKELTGVTWTSSNSQAAKVSEAGLLEPQNYGIATITAQTADGITLTEAVDVVNEIQGFSITKPETDNEEYQAIRTAEAAYQVAAGETYRVGCVLSPAYTDQYDSSVSMSGDRFDWKADNSAVTIAQSGQMMNIVIPAAVSGTVKITATMKDEEYKDKSFTITLDVLKKPEITTIPDTYAYWNYSNKLVDVALPANWQWKQPDTLFYEGGAKTFTACYTEEGYYPYETDVEVTVRSVYTSVDAQGNYSSKKGAYIVKKGTPLKMTASVSANDIPTLLYERGPIVAKDTAKVSVTDNKDGSYSVTASAKGIYTVSTTTEFKKAVFAKQGGQYALTAGEKAMDSTGGRKIMAVDAAPIQSIRLAVAPDSEENVTISSEGAIEYDITAANAASKQNERVIRLNVSAVDTDGNPVENPKINYSVSDTAVVKLKKEGSDKLVLTIPKGADGLAKIVATAQDDLGRSTQLAVRVKDYTPRVTTEKATINENYTYSKTIAQVLLPYEDGDDRIEKVSLVETANGNGADEVAGLEVSASRYDDYYTYRDDKFDIDLRVKDKTQLKKKGNLKYYLAVQTKAYGGMVFVPVQIKLETGMPTATLKQSGKVNVFYTDTTHLNSYDSVSMGLVEVSSNADIDSVRWAPGDGSASAVNTEFVIGYSSWTSKNGKYTYKYMIQQHRPVLDSKHKPSDEASKGTLYIKLSGYQEEISKPFTIQTVYKKPKLKVADYKVCPELGQTNVHQYIYTNAKKGNYRMQRGSTTVWQGYSDVVCADEEVGIVSNSDVTIRYAGTKNKKTQFTLYSDYWYESLTVPVNVKVTKSKVKLSSATVTLNTAYPTETTQTAAATWICNAETGYEVWVSDVGIEGANAQAQELLDKELLNINIDESKDYTDLAVSINYANAMGSNSIKPGSYKYKLTPYYDNTKLNDVTLTVKVIDKEASVKVRTKGTIDLVKLNYEGDGYNYYENPVVTVTPTFQNLDSSYRVQQEPELCGAYKNLFKIADWDTSGTVEIVPNSTGRLKAGKSYTLSVKYTVADAMYGGGGDTIVVTSNTFTIKPKQSVPKVTPSVKQLTLYASAKGEEKAETMNLRVPHSYKTGYYAISSVYGSLDVNKDGRVDLIVETINTYKLSGYATIKVYVEDADAVKAAAKGTAYKIPVTVYCVGRDGASKNATTTVSVVVKK